MPGNARCICDICNCGRHKCPHQRPRNGPPGECTLTEYEQKYVPHPLIPVQSCKPAANAARSDGPLSDETTHRIDYIPHPLEKPFHHVPDTYRPPEGVMDGLTSYQKDYTEKQGERAKPVPKAISRSNAGPFQGEPTYKSDYREWEIDRAKPINRAQQWTKPTEKFSGVPTYVTDFPGYSGAPPSSFKPKPTLLQSGPFESLTDYKQSYVPHELGKRFVPEKIQWQKPGAPFEGLTTFQRDYTPKAGGKGISCKPAANAQMSNDPLMSDTTHRVDYRPWEVSKPALHQHEPWRQPEGDMDHNTSYLNDYIGYNIPKQAAFKPKEQQRTAGPFSSSTDYKENYVPWQANYQRRAAPQREKEALGPFDGLSTHKAHFVPHDVKRTQLWKPDQKPIISGPFEGDTMYRSEYVPKYVEPCPATQLDTPRAAFVFKEEDGRGHKLYVPLPPIGVAAS